MHFFQHSFWLVTSLLVAACAAEQPVRDLGSCWDINQTEVGLVRGEGVFTTSMEGMSLQPPACENRYSVNRFEIVGNADAKIGNFPRSRDAAGTYLSFAFVGRVVERSTGKVLLINNVYGMSWTEKPKWMREMRTKLQAASKKSRLN